MLCSPLTSVSPKWPVKLTSRIVHPTVNISEDKEKTLPVSIVSQYKEDDGQGNRIWESIITLETPISPSHLMIKNYYAEHLTVELKSSSGQTIFEAKDICLMPDSETYEGGEEHFKIPFPVDTTETKTIRLSARQSCKSWKTIEIQKIQVFDLDRQIIMDPELFQTVLKKSNSSVPSYTENVASIAAARVETLAAWKLQIETSRQVISEFRDMTK